MRIDYRAPLAVLALVLLSGCYSTPTYAPTPSARILAVKHWSELDTMIKRSRQPLAVVFLLPTCHHCQALSKKLPALAGEYPGIQFVTVDSSRTPYLPYRHGVKGYPTTIVFSGGRKLDRFGGNRFMFMLRGRFDQIAPRLNR